MANDMILDVLKKRLYWDNDKHPGRWLKELLAVDWGLRTQHSCNTGVSLYFMVFGSEAMLPADITFQSPRVENHDMERSNEAKELEVNCVRNNALTPVRVRLNTWRACASITTTTSRTCSSWSVIWFCRRNRRHKACTN
jgi:hypothetical protein